jgi:exodeoxyribonuclease VII small subunit
MAKTVTKKKSDGDGEARPSFEDALARLEEIVELLDDGNLPLDESLALFKEGTKLAKSCRELLAEAEVQVKEALREVELPDEDEPEAE